MKIREKLFLAFGLYIVFAAILGFFAYRELRTIDTRLTLVEIADDITNTILEVRRHEKNYLLYRDRASLEELTSFLSSLKESIDNIKSEIINEIGMENYGMMKAAIADYEQYIAALAGNFSMQSSLAGQIQSSGTRVQQSLAPADLAEFLALRRHEKNIMLYKDADAYAVFSGTLQRSHLLQYADIRAYRGHVDRLYTLYADEQKTTEALRVTARKIQQIAQNVSLEERKAIETTITWATRMLIIALLLVIVIGIAVNKKLATSIAVPIRNLERITKKIARGDFSESIEVRGGDEIASLGQSFNQMEEKLEHAMTALEEIINKLQEKQAQLVEAEKLASVGRLAAGIAHEINNPLTAVLTFSSLMLEQCPKDDPRCDKLALIARETTRARNIVRQLLNFGREIIIKPERLNVNNPVTEIIESLEAQGAFKDLTLTMDLAGDLPDVSADPAQIGQVVLNLLLNAIHAIEPPGKVHVATRNAGKTVDIDIADTGSGIAPEHLNKIFDPFYTTKDALKGTGLGLAVSYGIIKKHGGDIKVASEVGKGTTFTVRLPLHG